MNWLNQTHVGDCRQLLIDMIADGVKAQTCVTSPPYFGLRDYGHAEQIGLERTPDEYVAQLVDVFRSVRQVLEDNGTLWLNLGDSYNAYNGGAVPGSKLSARQTSARPRLATGYGLQVKAMKPKDLLGIPWRVAFALQAPYYAGRIKREIDRIWLAAMIDAEGCIFIHRRKAGQHNGQGYVRQNDSFAAGLEVSNTSIAIVNRCKEITGLGSICTQGPDETGGRRKQLLYRWNLRTVECVNVLREVYPYLVAKQHQARIACACHPSGDQAIASHLALIDLHRGRVTSVDFNPPRDMYEPGFYLRSDVIWSKPNPMPESVTDRPTKAHEYLFLLAKSGAYYYDAAAIAEEAEPGSREPSPRKAELAADGIVDQRTAAGFARGIGWGDTRNRRTVWTVAPKPQPEAHFACFPPELIEPCILAGAPAGGIVLDPFMGSGTTARVASSLGRQFIGCELNPAYTDIQDTIGIQAGMAL